MVYLTSTGVAASTANIFISTSNVVSVGQNLAVGSQTIPTISSSGAFGTGSPLIYTTGTSTGNHGVVHSVTGGIYGTANVCINTDGTNANIELRNTSYTGTPYIDFSASPLAPDFTARIILNSNVLAFQSNSYSFGAVGGGTGNVGIGTTSPGNLLHIQSGTGDSMQFAYDTSLGTSGGMRMMNLYAATTELGSIKIYSITTTTGAIGFFTHNGSALTERMRILANGNVGIGTTSPSQKLHISGGDPHTLYGPSASYSMNLAVGSGNPPISSTTATVTCSNGNLHIDSAALGAAGRGLYLNYFTSGATAAGNGSGILSYGPWTHTGNFTVTGGTKSFRIPHPVVPNKDLVHSCIEGPRNDLMYRGTVTLVNGTATVDMNKNSTTTPDCAMTDGTFEALCTNPQFFLQNMSGFDRIRGTMSGANLVIISENQTSTDVISWMVVAERHDAAMISTDSTNDAGYLVTEHDSLPPNPYSSPPPS
jgi:hypothetical protein